MHARGPLLKDGGREGIRTPGLLIASEEKSKRHRNNNYSHMGGCLS
jgi:hypothetical protein